MRISIEDNKGRDLFWGRCNTLSYYQDSAPPLCDAIPPASFLRPSVSRLAVSLCDHGRGPKRFKLSATFWKSAKFYLLLGLLSVLSNAALAQIDEAGQGIDASSDSQDWSHNWSEGWKDRQKQLSAAKQRLTHWQLSEHTLLTFYGQINIGQLDYHDGFVRKATIRDNPNSPTRIGLRSETEFENGGSLFLNLEAAVPKGKYKSSVGSNIGGGNDNQWDKSLLRKAEGRLSVPQVGFFSFGQGNMAADGITGFDFSGTALVAYNSVGDTVSGIPARLADGTETSTDLSSFFPNYDAARRLRVRYDSLPSRGLSWAVSVGREVLTDNNDTTYADVAIRYETKWRRFGVKGGIAYAYNGESPDFLSGSVAGLDDTTGLNFAIAVGANTIGGKYIYGKAGIIRNIFKLGSTAFSADYYTSSSPLNEASGSQSWGLAIVQKFDAQDLEIYAAYRDYTIDGSVLQFADSRAILVGARFSW